MSWKPIWRIARHDAWETMRSWTYLMLVLAPLLLTLLLAFLVLSVAILLSLLQVAAPEGAPLGHNLVAVSLEPGADEASRATFDRLVVHLKEAAVSSPREARIARRFTRFLREATHPGLGSRGTSGAPSPLQQQGLNLEVTTDTPWSAIKTRVPDQIDAALFLRPAGPGQVAFEIQYEPALLYSRTMERRLQDRVASFNAKVIAVGKGALSIAVLDRPEVPPDLWLLRALVVAASFGLAFLYHSVGVQSVAGVLAGERESRTMEILLSLPITRRQVLYGKLGGLVLTTALPTLAWSALIWIPLKLAWGITLPYLPLSILIVATLVCLTATGCAVSAASPNTMVAKNRLGSVNMAIFLVSGAVMGLPSALWPDRAHPLAGLLKLATHGEEAYGQVALLTMGILVVAAAILELGLIAFKRG